MAAGMKDSWQLIREAGKSCSNYLTVKTVSLLAISCCCYDSYLLLVC
jgi:hypothetical protein